MNRKSSEYNGPAGARAAVARGVQAACAQTASDEDAIHQGARP